MLEGRFSEGIFLADSNLDGIPYISYPRAVQECSYYFLNQVPSRNGDPVKGISEPSYAEGHEEAEGDEKDKH